MYLMCLLSMLRLSTSRLDYYLIFIAAAYTDCINSRHDELAHVKQLSYNPKGKAENKS